MSTYGYIFFNKSVIVWFISLKYRVEHQLTIIYWLWNVHEKSWLYDAQWCLYTNLLILFSWVFFGQECAVLLRARQRLCDLKNQPKKLPLEVNGMDFLCQLLSRNHVFKIFKPGPSHLLKPFRELWNQWKFGQFFSI